MAVLRGMIKGARKIQEYIYDCWYGNVNSKDGRYRLNSNLYFERKDNYQSLTYMGFRLVEMQRGSGGWIQINSSGYGGKLLSSTDCNYIRGCAYDVKIKGGRVFFEGIDITDELQAKGYVRLDIGRSTIISKSKAKSKKMLKANDIRKVKNLFFVDIINDFMNYVGGTEFELAQQEGKKFVSGYIYTADKGYRFIDEVAEEFCEAYNANIEVWDDGSRIGISIEA